MQESTKIIGIGAIISFAIIVLGLGIFFNSGFPIFDPGINEDNSNTLMIIERKSIFPSPSDPYLNITESQINQCIFLKTVCQELILEDQNSIEMKINKSQFNCVTSFLEFLSPLGTDISMIYYQGFFFEIAFIVA